VFLSRVRQALETTCSSDETKVVDLVMPKVRGYLGRLLDLTQTFISPSLLRSERNSHSESKSLSSFCNKFSQRFLFAKINKSKKQIDCSAFKM